MVYWPTGSTNRRRGVELREHHDHSRKCVSVGTHTRTHSAIHPVWSITSDRGRGGSSSSSSSSSKSFRRFLKTWQYVLLDAMKNSSVLCKQAASAPEGQHTTYHRVKVPFPSAMLVCDVQAVWICTLFSNHSPEQPEQPKTFKISSFPRGCSSRQQQK